MKTSRTTNPPTTSRTFPPRRAGEAMAPYLLRIGVADHLG